MALENALRKARAAQRLGAEADAAAAAAELVLGCDTLVALDGAIYGKPRDEREARATLRALSGATHEVLSGLALLGERCGRRAHGGRAHGGHASASWTRGLLDWYLARGEWRGRAGGYAIQGAGAALVREVEGDYENVVGLPLAALLDLCPELLFACK